ncbi:HEPN domain-containing protein [Bacillus altitudinis]|uniref:HEPN domain-containing protein n=1 Tax=Bacillus altitudinis TaxID=293387 RepID=UPI00227FBC33|nr:HEPN domain-containing protein [Bacillus altitudinis]MCY7579718.1 HEPN domain-containing protein [Bacillus altitudinis]MCY7596807.1 HEPN domain-containing protein [Bacillus altitudinis]
MKFRFICVLHRMKLETIKNKGTVISLGVRISNGSQILSETLETNLMRYTLGVHSNTEFVNSVYVYIDDEFKNIHTQREMDELGVKYTFIFLRQVQEFIHCLWEIKDNNIYVRDGFLLAYNNHFEDGCTYKASLSEVYSYSTNENKESEFSDIELISAIQNFVPSSYEEHEAAENFGGKIPNAKHFFKEYGSNRMNRAIYFTSGARKSAILPMKIVLYCNALECLFTIGASEVNHKIAERVALMIGNSKESRKELFKLIKDAYNYRSKLVHGQYLKGSEENLVSISKGLDKVLREFIVSEHEIFSKSDNEMEKFFLELLFNYTSVG